MQHNHYNNTTPTNNTTQTNKQQQDQIHTNIYTSNNTQWTTIQKTKTKKGHMQQTNITKQNKQSQHKTKHITKQTHT